MEERDLFCTLTCHGRLHVTHEQTSDVGLRYAVHRSDFSFFLLRDIALTARPSTGVFDPLTVCSLCLSVTVVYSIEMGITYQQTFSRPQRSF